MTSTTESFFGNLGETLFVQEGVDHDGFPVLEIMADVGDQTTAVSLTPYSVRRLRLYLGKWEKKVAAKQDLRLS
jgi:hypothetical protein